MAKRLEGGRFANRHPWSTLRRLRDALNQIEDIVAKTNHQTDEKCRYLVRNVVRAAKHRED